MKLLNLADVIRAAGLKVEEVPGWKSRGGEMSAVRGVIWHHTATPAKARGDYPTLALVRDGRGGSMPVPGPLSQLGLGRSGTVYVIAAGRANHAGSGSWSGLRGNSDTIGIEMESPGDGSWTPAQLAAMPVLRDALSAAYGVPASKHIAHREWAPKRKIDPTGINIRSMRSISVTPPASTPSSLESPMTENDAKALAANALAAHSHAKAASARAENARKEANAAHVHAKASATGVAAVASDVAALREQMTALAALVEAGNAGFFSREHEPVRRAVYTAAAGILASAVAAGWLTADLSLAIGGALAAMLAIPAAEVARARVTPAKA